ncbi:electron transport complex protein RnfG [Orenia metallireducens]|jgi:electron transport complex protein RnfG|uniref:Ion-translocating oxidoreductase complex subunit G n=1 Tax=Orenia metallireducens TaxID=1413210 RepID=A0A285HAW8_9FIRM|nr:RnfABCDGE type electron transport complex subunit G [Orenia metallireducens]PRX28958.1 electron transport complex protein RnfG [Orenia metallireducens]SNY32794.1 electron transport complex protein RnfG [Orenia metallireducens]
MGKEKIDIKLIVVLTSIMIISALVLSLVYQATTPLINEHAAQAKKEAILDVLPGAVKYEKLEKGGLELYQGLDEAGSPVGIAFQHEGNGFQGTIILMIGMDVENQKLLKVKILDQLDTPGLGARMAEEEFKGQFQGKSFSDNFVAKEDVDAIAGATISSQAVSNILKDAIATVEQAYSGGE